MEEKIIAAAVLGAALGLVLPFVLVVYKVFVG